jgi:SAM-dependent methyltransferase
MQGLAISGESKDFFARGRIRRLKDWWLATGRPAPRRIIDYGCGIGDVTVLLAEGCPSAELLGLDPSSECIARARRECRNSRIQFSALSDVGTAGSAAADLVHTNGVVHHVAPAQRKALFEALRRSVVPGGVVTVFENNPLNPGTRLVMARIPFDRGASPVSSWAVRRLVNDAGLVPLLTVYLFYFPRFLKWLRPLERLLERVPLGAQYGVFASHPSKPDAAAPVAGSA